MRFEPSPEHRALGEAARALIDDLGPDDLRTGYEDVDAFPRTLWDAGAKQGWLATLAPVEQGGLGAGLVAAATLARALGGGLAPGPFVPTLLVGEAVRLCGNPEQRAEWLPALIRGDLVGTLSLSADWAAPGRDSVRIDADGGSLTGSGGMVEYATSADLLAVACTDGTVRLVRLSGTHGIEVEPLDAMDGTTRLARVTLTGVAAECLAKQDGAREALLARGAVLTAAELVGVAERAVWSTVAHLRSRRQFGRPLGGFQALGHQLADLWSGVVMAGHGVLYAAHALDEGLPDRDLMVSVAKAKASDIATAATATMIQYHGALGFTWEHESHLLFKRAHRQAAQYGDARWHRERIAALTLDGAR